MRPCWLLLLGLLVLLLPTGCAGLRRPPATAPDPQAIPIQVFHDGFHAGFLLPAGHPDLRWLDETTDALSASPLIEIGFAADNWIAVRDPGSGTTCATAVWGGPGVLMGAYLPTGVRPPRSPEEPLRVWSFRVSASQWTKLMAYLHEWADVSIRRVRLPGVNQIVLFSTKRWMLHRNCNDFVIDGLRVMGLDSNWRLGYVAEGFQHQLDVISAAIPEGHALVGAVP